MASESSDAARSLPQVDFSTFVLSLATAALYQLGAVPEPGGGATPPADPLVARQTIETLEMLREKTRGNLSEEERELMVARQTIETLEMLREKTRGNLSEEERELIDSLLYDLRMRFVELTR